MSKSIEEYQEDLVAESIYGYFVEKLCSRPDDDTLMDLPTESPCGEECKKVIDAASAMMDVSDKAAHPAIITAANTAVAIYWRG